MTMKTFARSLEWATEDPALADPEADRADVTAITAAILARIAALKLGQAWQPGSEREFEITGFTGFTWSDLCTTLVRRHPELAVAGRELECAQEVATLVRLCGHIFNGISDWS
jgi:hypothetical protein